MTEPLFEVVDELPQDEPKPQKSKRTPKYDTTDRTVTGWFKLPHRQTFCTVPLHDAYQELLSDEAKEYRQRYPVRMTYEIGNYTVCRDCYLASADIESAEKGLAPSEHKDVNG